MKGIKLLSLKLLLEIAKSFYPLQKWQETVKEEMVRETGGGKKRK